MALSILTCARVMGELKHIAIVYFMGESLMHTLMATLPMKDEKIKQSF